jgi:asparagine N-glycosylation enzyme membrane subunit Stt3
MPNLDITNTKVVAPTLLFAALGSGMIWFVQKNGNHTMGPALLVNALLFALIYYVLMKFVLKKELTRADIMIPMVLYILLTPGVLLTIPPGSKGLLMSGQTSGAAVAVHTLVFALVFSFLRSSFPQYY